MKKILLTDDAAFMRHILKKILEEAGFEIAGEADNGDSCVSLYTQLKPDIAILDITMPIKDGIQAAKEIMKIDPNAKIIMCSALGHESKVIEALEAGAKDFIVKPFDAERIIQAINRV